MDEDLRYGLIRALVALPVLALWVVPIPIAWAKGRRLGAVIGALGTPAFSAAAILILGGLTFRSDWAASLVALMWLCVAAAVAALVIGIVSAMRSARPGSSWGRRRSSTRP